MGEKVSAGDSGSRGLIGLPDLRAAYEARLAELRGAFEVGATGGATVRGRSDAVDVLLSGLWQGACAADERIATGVVLVAVGGYGRRQLFPQSDVDLLFLLGGRVVEKDVKDAIRRVSQELWDCGIRVAPTTRKLAECDRFDPENAEFTLGLMDSRMVAGDAAVYERLTVGVLPRLLEKSGKAVMGRLLALTRERHARYGGTLFHLEPNIKDCPGGLRDVQVCGWLEMLTGMSEAERQSKEGAGQRIGVAATMGADGAADEAGSASGRVDPEFREGVDFLMLLRCFLHYRHGRDDNTLDWQAQDAAALARVGTPGGGNGAVDAAYWMRLYFRHARSVEQRVMQTLAEAQPPAKATLSLRSFKRSVKEESGAGFGVEAGRIVLRAPESEGGDPALDPYTVLGLFSRMAETGWKLGSQAEMRLSQALPVLSAHLEEGPALWHHLREVLLGQHAGDALRSMHALGLLELLIPEFHGIDALVIRDAYHRYTVDEHTFVLIDTLHGLATAQTGARGEWAQKFASLLREIPHADLLYLAALLHDTGKGRSTGAHTVESARMAESVLARLEVERYEAEMVTGLITNHLEMSAALRRDIFDAETVRAFAGKVLTPEALRMLTLFTYADLNAVHPDALTLWKAENLWRLYMATANYLDRSVDEERVGARETDLVERVAATLPGRRAEIGAYLEGFPERYVRTRTPEQVRAHFLMSTRFGEDPVQLQFRHGMDLSEITLVTRDRALLFATMAGALAAWGMNIVSADAFSNRQGVVVDSFRFTDTFRTLELNESEHDALVRSVHEVMAGTVSVERLLSGRRRGRKRQVKVMVKPELTFNDQASSHSTLLEVVAQDTPGLLRALSLTLAAHGCNIEVALVDTEGETAIDVFYLTRGGGKLEEAEEERLRSALIEAMEENAR
jgi:[protein-PII] uridylyltransferase